MEEKKNSILIFFACLFAYLSIRLLLLPLIFDGTVLKLIDPDSYYHLRRILFTFENYPKMLIFDPFLSYPEGDFVPWPPLFDFFAATFSLPFSNPVYVICGIDLLISIILFVFVYCYQKRTGFVSLLFTILIITTSLSLVKISSYGSIDHHILEVVLVFSFYILWIKRPFKEVTNRIFIVIIIVSSFFNWPGAILYYAPAFLIIADELFKNRQRPKNILELIAGFFVTGAVIEIYFNMTGNNVHPYSFRYLSEFQRDLCFFVGGELLLLYLLLKIKRNYGWLLLFVLSVANFFVFNRVFIEIFKGLNYLSKSNESLLMQMVSESNPILFSSKSFFSDEFLNMVVTFTPFVLLYPFIIFKSAKAKKNLKTVIVSLYFFICACVQIRFSIFFIPFFAVLFGQTIDELLQKIKTKFIIVFICLYYVGFSWIFFINAKVLLPKNEVLRTMDFLQFRTPLSKEFDAGNVPYGILSSWDMGHYIITLGNRPAAAHNFIAIAKNNKERAYLRCIFAKNESDVVNVMKEVKTPFLVVSSIEDSIIYGWDVLFQGRNPYLIKGTEKYEYANKITDLFLYNLIFDMPANNLRLVFESDSLASMDKKTIAVYENVEGAKVLSREKGEINVVLRTPYREVNLMYQPVFQKDMYIFNIPYSNDRIYDVYATKIDFIGKKTVSLKLTEQDVLFGKTILVK